MSHQRTFCLVHSLLLFKWKKSYEEFTNENVKQQWFLSEYRNQLSRPCWIPTDILNSNMVRTLKSWLKYNVILIPNHSIFIKKFMPYAAFWMLNKFKRFFQEIYLAEDLEFSQWTRNLNAVFDNTEIPTGKPWIFNLLFRKTNCEKYFLNKFYYNCLLSLRFYTRHASATWNFRQYDLKSHTNALGSIIITINYIVKLS